MSQKPVIELIRVSTESQAADDRAGIPAQHAANLRTSQSFGLQIVRTIQYADVSGAAVLLAPEMQELLRLIADPEIHGVVAREFSRLMRPENFTDYTLLQTFVDTDTLLYLPEGPIDFASKTGRVWGVLRAAWAGLERIEFLDKSWGAKEEKRRSGGFSQSRVCLPYGVGHDSHRGWHYTAKAELVRAAFLRLLSGELSYTALARPLGVSIPGLRAILRNPIYTGWRVISERRDPRPGARRTKPDGRQKDRPKIKRAEGEIIRVKVIDEPLVTEAEFRRVQVLMDGLRERNARTRVWGKRGFSYNGFLRCARCSELVYTHHRRDRYYACKARKLEGACESGYMRQDRLDPFLDMIFAERLTDRGFLSALVGEMRRRADDVPRPPTRHDEARAQAKRARILDLFVEGEIDALERARRLARLDAEATEAGRTPVRRAPPVTADALADLFAPFAEFAYLSRGDKRRLLSSLGAVVRVADYHVTQVSVLAPRGDDLSLVGTGSSRPRA